MASRSEDLRRAVAPDEDPRYKALLERGADFLAAAEEIYNNPNQHLLESIKGRLLYGLGVNRIQTLTEVEPSGKQIVSGLFFDKEGAAITGDNSPEIISNRFNSTLHLLGADATISLGNLLLNGIEMNSSGEGLVTLSINRNETFQIYRTLSGIILESVDYKDKNSYWKERSSKALEDYSKRFGTPVVDEKGLRDVIITPPVRGSF